VKKGDDTTLLGHREGVWFCSIVGGLQPKKNGVRKSRGGVKSGKKKRPEETVQHNKEKHKKKNETKGIKAGSSRQI